MASQGRRHVKISSPYDVELSRDLLKPVGIMSNNYNKHGLKKIEGRKFVSSKHLDNNLLSREYEPNTTLQKNQVFLLKDKEMISQKNSNKKSLYDIVNHIEYGYDQKLHRDDRTKLCHLSIHEEKMKRRIPATTNAVYGDNRYLLEIGSQYGHKEICRKEFSQKSGLAFS